MSTSTPRLLGGRYEVGELIGRGGMAEVHLGHDARLGRPVAIKILRTDHARDAAFLTRFRREAQSVAGLNHRSIVAVYDSGEDRITEAGGATLDIPYIVMEYVHGRTLREVLNDSDTGTVEPREAARIVQQVLEALDYSHEMGIVHRDIKPGNVMVADDGSVKVMDFGIARAVADTQATMTQTQAVIGTAQYISPEQARGETVDKRSDVYSTGCLLFELLTGRTPYVGEPISLTYQHVNADIPLPSSLEPDLPRELDAIIVHALTKDRDERYPDARSMAEDLAAYRDGMPISPVAAASLESATQSLPVVATGPAAPLRAEPDTASMPATDARRRRPTLGWLFAALLVIPLALLGWYAWDASQGPDVVEVSVPRVVGMDEARATSELDKVGLEADVETVTSDQTEGEVVKQNPTEGTSVPRGDTVVIEVSGGPDQVTVPSIVGLSRQEAESALRKQGLELGTVTREDSPEQEADHVISTDPGVAEQVAKGSSVDIVVASGEVPLEDYTGQQIDDVRTQIFALNLEVSVDSETSTEKPGTILGQDPGAGTVEQGSTVTFVVAREPDSTQTTTITETPDTSTSEPTTTDEPTTDPTTTDSPTTDPTTTDSPTTDPTTTDEPTQGTLSPSPRTTRPSARSTTQSPASPGSAR